MIDTFSRICYYEYALMSNLCKLGIYLHNKLISFVMIRFSTSNLESLHQVWYQFDWILYIINNFFFCINYVN